ncbi:unnamed protein product [Psylliodes chrysocephalus]|uniref:Carboxylic ester hydrolase n=1 Tax=Psylliodes chrysocephalus TaxID=3402493 RepID=A0A9P0CQN8_9CUCU|nr:unnamed protein product [Psylliodes chrysocephala]
MLLLKTITLFLLIIQLYETNAVDVLITIPNGTLKGRLEFSLRKSVRFNAFQNIPYAKPPINDLRFMDPEPAEPWEGVLDASSTDQRPCFQVADWGNFTGQTEDCLYLNVYSPEKPYIDKSLPVIFYIYGGGFNSGYSGFYQAGPHYLIESGVVVVTVGYRVGPFGFLSTGEEGVPGNQGLKDQNLALRWVKDNIKYFGGDPDKITIMGGSAGGSSVTYHMMSPKSRGLFRAGISHSGSLLCPWSYQSEAKSLAYKLAVTIDPQFNLEATSEELVAYLKSVSAESIIAAAKSFGEGVGTEELVQGFFWAPVIEHEHDGAFITESPYQAVESGKMARVPLLIGINSEEALDRITYGYFPQSVKAYDADVKALVNKNMGITDPYRLVEVGTKIRNIYTNGGLLQENIANAIRYFSDMSFTRSVIRHAQLQSAYSDVYFYQFSYDGQLGGIRPALEGAERVAHSVEGSYVWCYGNSSNLESNSPADVLTSERFRTLLTNFVKYLDPTPEAISLLNRVIWPTVKNDDFKYLNINVTLNVDTDPKKETYSKWVELYENEAEKPYVTY